jgi:hypothetical protein
MQPEMFCIGYRMMFKIIGEEDHGKEKGAK